MTTGILQSLLFSKHRLNTTITCVLWAKYVETCCESHCRIVPASVL